MERVYLKKGPNRDVVKGYEREVLNGLNDIDYEYTPYGVYKLDEDNCYNPIINYSYVGTDSFWKGYCDGGKFVVNSVTDIPKKEEFVYTADLNKRFISIEEFLNKADYIGQIGYRTKPLMKPLDNYNFCLDMDSKYMNKNNYIILFRYYGILLAYNIESRKYEVISSKYTYDNNFEFVGPVYYDMADKNAIVNDIYNQLSDNKVRRR